MAHHATRDVVSSIRINHSTISDVILVLKNGSHAYEITQVAEQNWQSDKHGAHFGTKVMAVHERARREIHVGAVHRLESYSVYDFVQPRRTR